MPFASDILASVFRQKYVDAVRLLYQFVTIMKRETHSPSAAGEAFLGWISLVIE
jgi:hypothetical protein